MPKFIQRIQKWWRSMPRCRHCGSLNVSGGHYIRGWNNFCGQASGDRGYFCMKCCKVTFIRPFKEYAAELPEWVTPYKDSETA